MRKLIVMGLVAALALALAGCGNDQEKADQQAKQQQAQQAKQEQPTDKQGEVEGMPSAVGGGIIFDDGLD
jgi:PBP1b-binding outer membrane lipoprotein LpoB